ncbi:MAG: septal ring lytic transglycosylase RlpA family protein [Nitrospira sp.]|nr:septal ring lytic transglycosylase RlpA family protein [Nitrospira sp.]
MDKNANKLFPYHGGYLAYPLAACLLLGACSSLSKGELSLDLGIKDRGVASWYGKEFHGKLAANGEVFDMMAYTAAHRKLPLGSIVRVMNLKNGKSVQVRIADRGPYVIGRMLDLSHAAARELDMVHAGTTAVQIEVMGEHRVGAPIPLGARAAVAGLHITRDMRPARQRGRSEKGFETPTVPIRMRPQEALYVRRERRIGSMLAATIRLTIPSLCSSSPRRSLNPAPEASHQKMLGTATPTELNKA